MTPIANTLKKDKPASSKASKKSKTKSKEKKKKLSFEMPTFLKDDRTRKIAGAFLTVLASFVLLSGLSFVMTGESDLRLINDGHSLSSEATEIYKNLMGKIGAQTGKFLVHDGLGIAGLLIPILLLLVGIRLWFQIKIVPLFKTTRLALMGMIILPLLLGFIFHTRDTNAGEILLSCNDNLVGGYGVFATKLSVFSIGPVGTGLLLFFILGTIIIFNFNPKIQAIQAVLNKFKGAVKTDEVAEMPNEGRDVENEPVPTSKNQVKEAEQKHELELETNHDLQEEEIDAADSAIEELLGDVKTEVDDPPFIPEIPTESKIELETTISETAEPVQETTEELVIEQVSTEEKLSEDEIDDKVQQFGEYDPKLDLSRYEIPSIDLLEVRATGDLQIDTQELEANKNRIVETLNNYKIEISKIKATIGPTITLYEIVPAPGVRISKIKNLEDDIALSLSALGIRIIAPIPGKGTVGIEVPNSKPEIVDMRALIASEKFQNSDMALPVAIGKNISNETFCFDLAKMPHLLMAGATGQGKSVGLNAILVSLLYKKHPSQLKFVLVDPKKVELTLFNRIERHFLAKLPDEEEAIITDTKKVVKTLNSLCIEMDDRYELLKNAHCRNIIEYNRKFIGRKLNPENGHRYLPYIVLVVDEFADLIMTAGKEVETPIARLAQLARAIGIHLIIATQRPSVNIITGTIKANFPARIAFRVTSKIDSRTILDAGGADQLIGRGDMLFSTGSDLTRLQCGFVDTPEVEEITDFIGSQQGYPSALLLPEYIDEGGAEIGSFDDEDRDALFEDAARVIVMHQQGSASLLQRKLKLGYNRAGRIVDQLEAAGIIGPFEGSKARKVLIPDEHSLEQLLKGND